MNVTERARADGRRFEGPQGSSFALWASFNLDNASPVQLAGETMFDGGYDRIVSQQAGPDWYVFTARRGADAIYHKALLDNLQGVVHELEVSYPTARAGLGAGGRAHGRAA